MSDNWIYRMHATVDAGLPICAETAMAILTCDGPAFAEVLHAATRVRERRAGSQLRLCSIVNARSGACSENCAFCAQSAHFDVPGTQTFDLLDANAIVAARDAAAQAPIAFFSVVTSGQTMDDAEVDQVIATVTAAPSSRPHRCASLGCLSREQLIRLRNAGMKRYHHNLETAESFYPSICTTHDYTTRRQTVRDAKAVGLEVCCGGLLGMGESLEQRVELAMEIAAEGVDAIPLNFLMAIPGTPLESQPPMTPSEILRAVAMFRLVCPDSELRIGGGRKHLGEFQPLLFAAGAEGMLVGDLLTTTGQNVAQDLAMLADHDLEPSE